MIFENILKYTRDFLKIIFGLKKTPWVYSYKMTHLKNRIIFCNLLFSTSPFISSISRGCALENLVRGLQVQPRIFKIETSGGKPALPVST